MKSIKRYLQLSFFLFCFMGLMTTQQSCKTKEGCPVNDFQAKTDKKGNFKAGRAKSALFPKKMNKSLKKKSK